MVWIILCLDSSVNTVTVKVIQATAFSLFCSFTLLCMRAQSLLSRPTLRDPKDCSLPGSLVHGIFQARVLEWGAMKLAFFNFMAAITICSDLCSSGAVNS